MSRVIKFRAWDEATNQMVDVESATKPKSWRGANKFKGYEMRNGYKAIKMLSHPRKDGRGFVLEHRLVVEESMGRILLPDEIVHHLNHVRDDNRIENLEVLTDQKRHAAAHSSAMKRDEKSKQWIPDPALASKKFRLLNKDSGRMEIRTLSELINKTYRKGKFEYRGEWTGLTDKNGAEIYEGDICQITFEDDGAKSAMEVVYGAPRFYLRGDGFWSLDSKEVTFEVIGNIHQNPELLK